VTVNRQTRTDKRRSYDSWARKQLSHLIALIGWLYEPA